MRAELSLFLFAREKVAQPDEGNGHSGHTQRYRTCRIAQSAPPPLTP
ncbi:MAG: hypothetical protein JWM16_1807, partial [Verrucomicrobiales bacterium]|nr:hypothetical protein [Verrucomicrobiales bacterium]